MNHSEDGKITFSTTEKPDDWIMKLERKDGTVKISFNHEDYPDACADDFAKDVIRILECHFQNYFKE